MKAFVRLMALTASAYTVFAGGVVNNCTETDLLAALSGGGLVTFNCEGVLKLSHAININESTTLEANGSKVTLSGGGLVRLFVVQTNVAFTVNGLTLADGTDSRTNTPAATAGEDAKGGAILSLGGVVNLTDCILTNNSANGGAAGDSSEPFAFPAGGGAYGGAIYALGGIITLSNCVVAGNNLSGGFSFATSGPARGGAVYLENGSAKIIKTTFLQNSATGGDAGLFGASLSTPLAGDAEGGAIYATNSNLFLQSCQLEHNRSHGGAAAWSGLGAGSARGGAIRCDLLSTSVIDRCNFRTNECFGGGSPRYSYGGDGLGGAIASTGDLTITDSAFSANQSTGGDSLLPALGGGGAVWSSNRLVLAGCTFDRNRTRGGSGIEAALGADGNAAFGGALWAQDSCTSTNCTFIANEAFGGDRSVGRNPGTGFGGAIAIQNAVSSLKHLTVAFNSAWNGETYFAQIPPTQPGLGGGIFVTNSAGFTNFSVVLSASILSANVTGSNAQGTIVDGEYNLSSDATPIWTTAESRNEIDPLLEALSDNGGPTKTMALLVGSPARDVVFADDTPVDQRGIARPQGIASDIGAVEADVVETGPTILQQPEGGVVRVGDTLTIKVTASGTGPLAYQWTRDNSLLPNATNAIFSITNVQPSDAGSYQVVVSNSLGRVSSNPVQWEVDGSPIILSQPASVEASPGASVDFSVLASGPALEFIWMHNGSPVPEAGGQALHIETALAADKGDYFVIVSNSFGRATSAVVTLSFDESALKILSPPANQTVEDGSPATFRVVASGVPPITYQWRKDGVEIAGARSSEITLAAAHFADAGTYSVVVSNDYRVVISAEASLTVLPGADRPRLDIAKVISSGPAVAITFTAENNRVYRLLKSTNLVDFLEVQRKSAASAGTLQFVQPIDRAPGGFFKVVTP